MPVTIPDSVQARSTADRIAVADFNNDGNRDIAATAA
jgi:hypothetical protein